jgi:hypothetical protein
MLHILPAAVLASVAIIWTVWLQIEWAAGTLRCRDKAWGLSVLVVLYAAAAVSSASFLASAFGPA